MLPTRSQTHYNNPMPKIRLDLLLVARGLAESRAQAQRLVMAGQVRVAGEVALKPSLTVEENAPVEVELGPPFVSRGGEKLLAALEGFGVSPQGQVCADVGASTGGFTDCLLQHGAARVYAIDVGQGILHWKLRQDARVVVLEGVNVRYLERLPEPVTLITIDLSFISLKQVLPVVRGWFPTFTPTPPLPPSETMETGREEIAARGELIALIKPQFEAGRRQAARGQGVIRDPAIHRQVLLEVLGFAAQQGYGLRGLMPSPLLGPKGNREFLAWLVYPAVASADLEALVEGVIAASPG